MPIADMRWRRPDDISRSTDVHVLRGSSSPSLLEVLEVKEPGVDAVPAADYVNTGPNDVMFECRPLFKVALTSETLYEGLGLHVHRRTGVVDVDTSLPSPAASNFIIEISARNNAGGPTFGPLRVRVHVHSKVKGVWLTPDPLTVRRPPPLPPPKPGQPILDPRDTRMRFLVRAEFDDGVIGDLTLGNGTTWSPATNVNDEGRLLVNPGDGLATPILVVATLDARFGGPPAGGRWSTAPTQLRVEKGWHELTPAEQPVAELVPGSGLPRQQTPETQVPNILMIADGWVASDGEDFTRLTTEILSTLRTSQLLYPYARLVDSMCFWRWFQPSPARGFSVVSEVYRLRKDGPDEVAACLPPVRPPPATGKLALGHLLYVVGLPMPGDEKRSEASLVAQWKQTCADFVESRVDGETIKDWCLLGTRTMVECVDSPFHMGLGVIPSAEADATDRFEAPVPFKGDENLKRGRTALRTAQTLFGGRPLGELWSDPGALPAGVQPPRFAKVNSTVCFVAAPGARAHSGDPVMLNTREDLKEFRVRPSAKHAGYEVSLSDGVVPNDLAAPAYVFAHELSHQFGLGDEYAERSGRYSNVTENANLQSEAEVSDPITTKISGDRIRWRWHRIEAAALIEGPIVPQGANFVIPVHAGHGAPFERDDRVLLRQREFGTLFTFAPKVLEFELQVSHIVPGDQIVVGAPPGTTLAALQVFRAGSIVFRPVQAPPSIRDPVKYPYMQLVTKPILDKINEDHAPLYADGCETSNLVDKQRPNLPGFDPLRYIPCLKNTWRVIGLYEGGGGFRCGIYHPAGWCLMRNATDQSTELCAVCRYLLADVIDPAAHGGVELRYRQIYEPE